MMLNNLISVVVNVDTRPNKATADVMLSGANNGDFLTEGIYNKVLFFKDHPIEVIIFVDVHDPIPESMIANINKIADMPNVNKRITFATSIHREYFNDHNYFPKWNDVNYLQALFLARGKYIAHCDGDTAAFLGDPSVIPEWQNWIDSGTYDYISYPSHWSPVAITDASFDYVWASTRFFFCKRDILKFDEILKCLTDAGYLYNKYPASRHCPWLEHVLGLLDRKVFYPPMQLDRYMIFSWASYRQGLYNHLHTMEYNQVKRFVEERGGISYPCDLSGNY